MELIAPTPIDNRLLRKCYSARLGGQSVSERLRQSISKATEAIVRSGVGDLAALYTKSSSKNRARCFSSLGEQSAAPWLKFSFLKVQSCRSEVLTGDIQNQTCCQTGPKRSCQYPSSFNLLPGPSAPPKLGIYIALSM